MNIQLSSKLAKLGARLAAVGRRNRDLADRIEAVERQPAHDPIALRRLKREKKRVESEVHYCEGMLRSLTRGMSV